MKSSDYVVNKLKFLMPEGLKGLCDHMKDHGGLYIAGGAITCIVNGTPDNINDFDVYFPSKEACVEAIRYMKDINPHVSFVSDKSITYALSGELSLQFIYNNFYPEAKDIFKTFDFYINMAAWDCKSDKLVTHDLFWMHNSQRFLGFNNGTSYPIISLLRVDKYKKRGYKTSRNEMIKLALSISELNITTWEEAKKHVGNTYGFNLADFKDCENTPYSLEALLERIEAAHNDLNEEGIPMQDQYLYPHNAVDFLLEGKPIEYVKINDEEQFIDPLVLDCIDGIYQLIEKGYLEKVEIDKSTYTTGGFYIISKDSYTLGQEVETHHWSQDDCLFKKEALEYRTHDRGNLLYKVTFKDDDLKNVYSDYVTVKKFTPVEVICRAPQIEDFKQGKDVTYRKQAKMLPQASSESGWAYSKDEEFQRGKIAALKELRNDFIENNILITDKTPKYAHNTFKGIIFEGGESITAKELLYFMDGWNLCFGGDITIKEDGTFSGRYNTD